jgi:hypothetical protein
VEAVSYTAEMGFDKGKSLKAFKTTLYLLLRGNCAACHADVDVNLAHEYALTRVNFRDHRHRCFAGSCGAANEQMLKAVTAWRDAVADMVPVVPRGVEQSTKITEQQVLQWIADDRAKTPRRSGSLSSTHPFK